VKIFVSYSRRDADFAQQIDDYFQDSGHDVFTDVKNIQVGVVWTSAIENNISNCDIFVIIITQATLRSTEVEKEVLQAQREKKKIIPCIHRDVSYDEIKWNLKSIQGVEFQDKYELSRILYSKIAGKRKHNRKSHKKPIIIVISIIIVAILGSMIFINYINTGPSALDRKIISPIETEETADIISPIETEETADIISPIETEETADIIFPTDIP
jgi:hypothetical protein